MPPVWRLRWITINYQCFILWRVILWCMYRTLRISILTLSNKYGFILFFWPLALQHVTVSFLFFIDGIYWHVVIVVKRHLLFYKLVLRLLFIRLLLSLDEIVELVLQIFLHVWTCLVDNLDRVLFVLNFLDIFAIEVRRFRQSNNLVAFLWAHLGLILISSNSRHILLNLILLLTVGVFS